MNRDIFRCFLKTPQSRAQIIEEFCKNKSVLDIGCVQHDIDNVNSENWLHSKIIDVASYVLGVDYLEDAVKDLSKRGFNVLQGDVNHPIQIDRVFDVVVVGNLIEHLSNFEGLMNNINRLLKPDGIVLISTSNPFYVDQYFFSAFRNDIIINPEHTCWIDPIALNQLANRFGLDTFQIRWIKERWKLSSGVIFNDDFTKLDIFKNKWIFTKTLSFHQNLLVSFVKLLLPFFISADEIKRLMVKYGDNFNNMLFLTIKSKLFSAYWVFRQLFIPRSDLNKYELYFAVLKKYNVAR